MKAKMFKTLTSLCSFALALTGFFHFSGNSLVFFGEPKHPDAD